MVLIKMSHLAQTALANVSIRVSLHCVSRLFSKNDHLQPCWLHNMLKSYVVAETWHVVRAMFMYIYNYLLV